MSKQVEVPEGVERFRPELKRGDGGMLGNPHYAVMAESEQGGFIRVADLPAIYKHFSDRLLNDESIKAADTALIEAQLPGYPPPGGEAAIRAALDTLEADRG